MNKITIINDYDGDLAGLYVNGILKYSTNFVYPGDLANFTPIESIEVLSLKKILRDKGYKDDEPFEYDDFPADKTLEEFLSSI
jgi:hypothetical protein